eukprot:Nitzschia sp. Nitz4//scaffold54_size114964//37951//39012//NITZ4_003844-RA/size114964-processed-gene-0.155-mRNA-1//1//CDS//3329554330//4388//frame0
MATTGILPATYRALRLATPGPVGNFAMETLPMTMPAANEVAVKVSKCAVAYRDVLDRQGAFRFINQPTVLGHEFVGNVEATGPGGESNLAVGDRVMSLHWDQTAAWPSPLTRGGAVDSMFGLKCDGGYAEYCTAAQGSFVKVGSQFDTVFTDSELACIMSTFGTVWQGAVVRGNLKEGEHVVVTGASGGVGSASVLLAKSMGCKVTAVTSNDSKVPFLESLGVDDVAIMDEKGMYKVPTPASLVVEAVGGPTFPGSLRAVAPGGRIVLVGNVENSTVSLPLGLCILNSISVIGSDSIEADAMSTLLTFMAEKDLHPKIHTTLPLAQAGEAHEMLENRAVQGRIVLDVTGDCVN